MKARLAILAFAEIWVFLPTTLGTCLKLAAASLKRVLTQKRYILHAAHQQKHRQRSYWQVYYRIIYLIDYWL